MAKNEIKISGEGEIEFEDLPEQIEAFFKDYDANRVNIDLLISHIDLYSVLSEKYERKDKLQEKLNKIAYLLLIIAFPLIIKMFIEATKSSYSFSSETAKYAILSMIFLGPAFFILIRTDAKELADAQLLKKPSERQMPDIENESHLAEIKERIQRVDIQLFLIDFVKQFFHSNIDLSSSSSFDRFFEILKEKSREARKEYETQKQLSKQELEDAERRERLKSRGIVVSVQSSGTTIFDLAEKGDIEIIDGDDDLLANQGSQ